MNETRSKQAKTYTLKKKQSIGNQNPEADIELFQNEAENEFIPE